MHTLTRLTLAGATIVIATGAALALVAPSLGPILPKPSPSAKVPPTPTVPPITTFTTPTAPPAPLDDNAHPPEGPSDTCPDGSPVFRYSIVDAAAGHRYLGVQLTNCGRPETIRLEALPDLHKLWIRVVDPGDEAAVEQFVAELREAEANLSAMRHEIHQRLDEATGQLIARYRQDPTLALSALPDIGLR